MPFTRQQPFSKKTTDLPDVPSPAYTPTQIKEYIETPSDENKAFMDSHINELEADTGAGNVGAKKADGTSSTVQTVLDEKQTKTALSDVTGATKVGAKKGDGTTSTVQGALDEKAVKGGDWTGTWQGYTPSKADPGISSVVEQHTAQLADIVTPEQYGAKGDGVTDDILALEQAHDYAYANNATLVLKNKTYGISRTFFVKENIEIEGLSNSVIKALSGFTGDAVIKSYDYDNSNLYSFGIFKVAIDGNWQNVYGLRLKVQYFGYSDLIVSNCRLGGLNTDRNSSQPILGSDTTGLNTYINITPRYFKCGRFVGFNNQGTTFYWNHANDSWIGEVECRGVNIASELTTDSDVSECGIHIGSQGQCEIDRVHVYGFRNCMIVDSRITANLLILESYFDRALWFTNNSTFSQIGKIEVFQNLAPTGPYTGLSEGDNTVPVVHINAYNGIQIKNLFIRQFWSDPEKVNDTTASSDSSIQAILDARKTKQCLVIDSAETHIDNVYIIGKQNGDINQQKYYPVGVIVNGNNNRINDGQVNFSSLGLTTTSKDTGGNFIKLNMYYTTKGWLNKMGTGTRGGNKYELYYKHDSQGSNSLFDASWVDIDLSSGERMKYVWNNGSATIFRYPSVTKTTFDLSAVISAQSQFLNNYTGKVTKDEEVSITINATGTTGGLRNVACTLSSHTQYGSTLYFDNNVATAGATAIVLVKIGI